jgi:TATA-binding protein-associated factor Taf7
VGTGDQSLQLTLGAANRSIRQKVSAGQTLRLDWKDLALAPPRLNAEAVENQDWDRVRSSPDAAQVRSYLAHHPTGTHAREAASRLVDLAWNAVDQSNLEAVRRFVRDNPENAHSKAEARKILDQYDAEQQRVAQERNRLEQAKLDQAKLDQVRQEQLKKSLAGIEQEKTNQERSRLEQSRRRQVLNTLRQLDSALQRKRTADVKAIWPSASKTFFDSLRSVQVEMSLSAEDVQFSQGPDRVSAM